MDLSPLWPPLYVMFLAALRWLGQGSWWLVPWVQGGLLLLSAWLLRRICRRLLDNAPESDLAAVLLLIYPPMAAFGHYFWPEMLHLCLMLLVVEILLSSRRGVGTMWGLGGLLGSAIASKALLTPWVPFLLWWVAWPGSDADPAVETPRQSSNWRGLGWRKMNWPACVAACLGLACVALPLMTWNADRVGVFTLSNSVAFNLWVGLEDTSHKSFVNGVAGREYRAFQQSGAHFEERQEVLWTKIRHKVRAEGWFDLLQAQLGRQYFRLFDKDTYFTDQLAGGVIADRGQGYASTSRLNTSWVRTSSYILYAGILVFACLGMTVSVPSRRPWLWAVGAFLIYNLAIFLALHVKSRYRFQMMPWMILYATCGLSWVGRRLAGLELPAVLRSADEDIPLVSWRSGLCAVGMLTVLYLAFSS